MVKLGLSGRKHLPVIKYAGKNWPLWDYFRLRKIINTGLELDPYAADIMLGELPLFEKYYLPPFPLKGKTVLDLGAGCGETAWFFIKHGAKKVICVEPSDSRVSIIEKNKQKLNLNIDVIHDVFRPSHLDITHDFLKCDIEGYEMELYPVVGRLGPTILEVHTGWIKDRFEKAGFHQLHEVNTIAWLMSNY
jgi:hypothetical protein